MSDNEADHSAQRNALVSIPSPEKHLQMRRSDRISSSKRSLSDLEEDLLIQILQRLPTAKDAFLCSSVCKLWYGIIFSPYFISRFVTYHANHVANRNGSNGNLGEFESSISIVTKDPDFLYRAIIILPRNPFSRIQALKLTSFCLGGEETRILSSCHDLLLCVVASMGDEYCRFFICNALTMLSISISVPKWEANYKNTGSRDSPFALVCEPYCSKDSEGGCILNAVFRYRIVCVRADKLSSVDYLPVEVYCSERGELIEDSLFGEEFRRVHSNLVVYNGKVHWYTGTRGSIVAYDPFRVGVDDIKEDSTGEDDAIRKENGFTIKPPDHVVTGQRYYVGGPYRLGVCRGHLKLIHVRFEMLCRGDQFPTRSLCISDLEDYGKGKWSVERKFCLDLDRSVFSSASGDHLLYKKMSDCVSDGKFIVVAPHPYDGDLVYLRIDNIITLCNLETTELHVVAAFDRPLSRPFADLDTLGFPLVTPWWPTPILPLQQH